MAPADPDPDLPVPDPSIGSISGPGAPPSDPVAAVLPAAVPTRRTIPFLAISVVLVAILAGSALFMSGYTMGRQTAVEPGTPRSGSIGVPAVLGHVPHHRRALRRR